MKLSEMRELLSARGIRLTKSLGQNFLHDGNQLRRILEAAELTKADKVLEVGPGLGPLTELLIQNAGEILAIEKDARLVEVMRERFEPITPSHSSSNEEIVSRGESTSHPLTRPSDTLSPSGGEGGVRGRRVEKIVVDPDEGKSERSGLHLVHDDALEFLRRESRDWSEWKLVANLPYSVASPILVDLAQSRNRPERMVVTLQLEVAKRLMAEPGDKDYGVLTLLIQLDYEPRGWFKIPASCFFPAPDVDSACVILVRRAKPLLSDAHREAFMRIVKRAFSQRRKMMFKLLKADWPIGELERAFLELKLSHQARAEALSLEQFVGLVRLLLT